MTMKPMPIFFSPLIVVFVAYVSVLIFQFNVVFPVEAQLFPVYSTSASLMFLPHAARVLATAIIGPKAFFALYPAILIAKLLNGRSFDQVFSANSILLTLVAAGCAPAGYVVLKRIVGQRFAFSELMLNWRYVFLTGTIASAINSIGLVVVFVAPAESTVILDLMLRFFVGDVLGLLVGLVILTFVFRILRNIKIA